MSVVVCTLEACVVQIVCFNEMSAGCVEVTVAIFVYLCYLFTSNCFQGNRFLRYIFHMSFAFRAAGEMKGIGCPMYSVLVKPAFK